MTVHVRCPAKVNLHLEILGMRSDGYRELRTLFAAVGVSDELWAEVAPEGVLELAVEPEGAAPADASNLVVKAAKALAERCRPGSGARLYLRKRIPAAGGLGGGSSDAAAALVALDALWGCGASRGELVALAAGLGADVPFFLHGGVAWGVGRGSEVYPVADLPAWWVVLLPGREPVPTVEVYRVLPRDPVDGKVDSAVYHWVVSGGELPLSSCRNDLQPTVVERWPSVGAALGAVRGTGPLLAMVSGSGGTVYGLYAGEAEARSAEAALGLFGPVAAPLLTRAGSTLHRSLTGEPWRSPKSASI
jgi:4-diphosphocytidyl-2-C-methyl-D-erythritol kinase